MTLPNLQKLAFFIALVATGLSLGGALAHLYELPNKIGMPREDYLIVQRSYDGWWQLAYVLAVQLAATTAAMVLVRHDRLAFVWTVASLGALVAAQVVFWALTYPANLATDQWTRLPADWEAVRLRWEYSHAAGAALQLTAFVALVVAVLSMSGREKADGPAGGPRG